MMLITFSMSVGEIVLQEDFDLRNGSGTPKLQPLTAAEELSPLNETSLL